MADAARGRSRADWLVGMNLSRAYTLAYGEEFSVGRVQTPTLAMMVERELAIRSFVARIIWKWWRRFAPRRIRARLVSGHVVPARGRKPRDATAGGW